MLDKTTDPKRETIERMASEGASSAQIGDALGMTRHAVIGYCYRRGIKLLQNGADGARKTAAIKRSPMRRIKNLFIPAKPRKEAKVREVPTPLPVGAVGIWDLKEGHCRWPLWGDHEPATGFFCGAESATGHSWCPAHCRMGYAGAA